MAEPIEMPFGLWARMLHGGPGVRRDVAMATTFWLSVYGELKRPCAAAMRPYVRLL